MYRDILTPYYLLKVFKHQRYLGNEPKKAQNKLLCRLIAEAYQNSPFYRKIFDGIKLTSKDIKETQDLKRLPVINRRQVREALEQGSILNRKYLKGSICRSTSGSSGLPLTVVYDIKSYAYTDAIYVRSLLKQGVRINDRIAYFWYEPFRKRSFWEKLGIFKKFEIIYTESEKLQFSRLEKIKPSVIISFPTLLLPLCERIKNKKVSFKPRIIITHGELLTEDTRKRIEEAFNACVVEQYDSNEFKTIAWQCTEGGNFHINDDSVFIETLNENNEEIKEGELGKIVITGLSNIAMPLIRYSVGDYGIKTNEICRCGIISSMLKSIEGRGDDFIITPEKEIISPRRIGGILEKFESIREYKFLQEEITKFSLFIIPSGKFSNEDEMNIREALSNVLSKGARLFIEKIQSMPRGKTGKIKAIESRVSRYG